MNNPTRVAVMYEYQGDARTQNSAINSGPSFLIECDSDGYVGVTARTPAVKERDPGVTPQIGAPT
ncbi:MAG: hypothetical protein AB7Q42_13375 [Acidimicrobiia bacterium]